MIGESPALVPVPCPCGITWWTTLGPLYTPECWDPKEKKGCRRKLPSREELLARRETA